MAKHYPGAFYYNAFPNHAEQEPTKDPMRMVLRLFVEILRKITLFERLTIYVAMIRCEANLKIIRVKSEPVVGVRLSFENILIMFGVQIECFLNSHVHYNFQLKIIQISAPRAFI